MNDIARIVTRAAGTDKAGNDGLIIGAMFKPGIGKLLPNRVYTIVEFDGVLTLRDEGECSGTDQYSDWQAKGYQFNWGMNVSDIMTCYHFVLTKEEYSHLLQQRAIKDMLG